MTAFVGGNCACSKHVHIQRKEKCVRNRSGNSYLQHLSSISTEEYVSTYITQHTMHLIKSFVLASTETFKSSVLPEHRGLACHVPWDCAELPFEERRSLDQKIGREFVMWLNIVHADQRIGYLLGSAVTKGWSKEDFESNISRNQLHR
jgi:hypothetical protein